MRYLATLLGACVLATVSAASAQASSGGSAAAVFKPTVDDWVGVNAAVDNYALGLDLHDMDRFDKAFWPEATIIAQPAPGMSFTMPYRKAAEGPPKAPPGGAGGPPPGLPPMGAPSMSGPPGAPPGMPMPGPGGTNAVGSDIPPWHLPLSHHFEFQSATHATHYGYFISVYPDLKTKITTVGLPGHYNDILEKRNGEWRILQRTTVIGAK